MAQTRSERRISVSCRGSAIGAAAGFPPAIKPGFPPDGLDRQELRDEFAANSARLETAHHGSKRIAASRGDIRAFPEYKARCAPRGAGRLVNLTQPRPTVCSALLWLGRAFPGLTATSPPRNAPCGSIYRHETYVSAIQNPPETPAWVSGPDVHPGRPRRPEKPPSRRPQAPDARLSLPAPWPRHFLCVGGCPARHGSSALPTSPACAVWAAARCAAV